METEEGELLYYELGIEETHEAGKISEEIKEKNWQRAEKKGHADGKEQADLKFK